MAALTPTATPTQHIQHERFTTEQHGYQLEDLSLNSSGNIAVCGRHSNGRTFIDLYFGRNSGSRDKLKLFYSKEFEKYSDWRYRYVSFLEINGGELLVTCSHDKIEIIDTKNKSKVLRSCRVNGEIMCLAVREGEIFIGLDGSQTVIVFNNDLKETKKIQIKGIQDGDCPCDLQVIKDIVFVCTRRYDRVLSISESDGSIITEYTDITGNMYSSAWSITVSERLGLVAVVWGVNRIIVYSLNENKSFLVFYVDSGVCRIRISDRDRMIITGNISTGEIKMYDLEQLFSFEAMKRTLAYIISPDECEELRKYFGVTEEELSRKEAGGEYKSKKLNDKEKTVRRLECLLSIIEGKGHLDPYNINNLKDAVSTVGDEMRVSNLKGPLEGYALYGINMKHIRVRAEMMAEQKAWEDERKQLSTELRTAKITINDYEKAVEAKEDELVKMKNQHEEQEKTLTSQLEQTKQLLDLSRTESAEKTETLNLELELTKQKLNLTIKEKETYDRDLEITKQVLEQTKQDRDSTRTELKQYQLDFAKESKALKEVLNQTKEAMAELHKEPAEKKPLVDTEETRDEDFPVLAAEFGRLTVTIAEHLTLDHCLKLAILFNVPASDCDAVRRLSLIESPGMKFLDILKKRKVINIYDVSNLQKGLAMLHLEAVNHDLVVPYQESIDDDQHELHKVEEMYTWEDVDAFVIDVKDDTAKRQIRESQISSQNDTEPGTTSQLEAKVSRSETEVEDGGSRLADRHHHQLYIEHSIGREGGTIQIANVSLTIPPDALHESHVIALSVMNESPVHLDREVDTARMTPLIKLEPLGLMFKKSLQLNIPHSALIPEPDNHDVIIYSGQISKNNEESPDCIQWTVERSLPRQLNAKSVTVDIQCLSYLSASLVSQTTAPPLYVIRAVLFVDGVRNTDDDIRLTICFCSDNDSDYNMLLSDYKTKLPLEQYSTLQLHRHSESDEDDAGFLSLTVTSVNNTYVPDAEQAVKRFAVSHLCTASRVSHQLRLKKNQDADIDAVDIMLTFSQAKYEPTKISLKARIKDLIISEESEKLLTGSLPPDNKTYEDMVVSISSSLDKEQCRELATYFQLTSEDTEMITSNQDPGEMLMKTLEEREVIDSQKMILFFEGLKACHLHKTAELVSEYISEISKQTQEKEQKLDEDKKIQETQEGTLVSQHLLKKSQRTAQSDQSVQTTFSSSCVSSDVHVKTLTKEGYTEHEVVEALDVSRNRLVMARKVLQLLGEQRDVLPKKDLIFLHKEQYVDENGGDINLREANVYMVIPTGAVSKGSIVSLTVMTSKQGNVPSEGKTPQLTPVIKCGQEGLTLNKPVTIRIPHCATETEGIKATDMYLGFSSNDEGEIQWRKRKQHEPVPVLRKDHFEVFLTQFCAISLNVTVDYKRPLTKRLRVLPLINRIINPSDDLTLTVWIYNDDETEHMHLLHEEINVGGKIQLLDFKGFTIKGLGSDEEVHVRSGNNKISPNTNMKKILSTTMWHNARHSVKFNFQNKEGINDIRFSLRICKRQLLRTVDDLQFDLKVMLSELLQKHQVSTRALIQKQEPQPAMVRSFQDLVSKLSGQLSVDSCLEIAGMFGLRADFRAAMKKNREPGKFLFDELIHEQFITAASVSALDVALTKTGNEHLGEHVKEYRMKYVTFPTTIFTML